jgi:hypothetical protein
MSARQQRSYIALGAALLVVLVALSLVPKLVDAARQPASGTREITPDVRAGTLRFDEGVAPDDRAWILAAIASARPEAQRLIAEVDGLVEIDTSLNRPGTVTPGAEQAIGLMRFGSYGARLSFDVARLDGDRAIDRSVVVLHELGHVIDALLISDEMIKQLDAGIPTVGTCASWEAEPTGACSAVEERFADTFAKWALGGRVSLAGSGYGIQAPASIEDWGQPLGLLAAQLTIKARG